ncbi:MAG: hypothetical protein WC382_10355 [Methanoregulaceae archaeon]
MNNPEKNVMESGMIPCIPLMGALLRQGVRGSERRETATIRGRPPGTDLPSPYRISICSPVTM